MTSLIKVQDEVVSAPMIGSVDAYMRLAYNLYLIAHNEELHHHLLNRLKNIDQFPGAYYETYVFAWLIKAGFIVEFENEHDRNISHVECIITNSSTKEKFCIEAKAIQRQGSLGATTNTTTKPIEDTEQNAIEQLFKALKKEAKYPRIVFINLNIPSGILDSVRCADKIHQVLTNKEKHGVINGQPAPQAYVFFTNNPSHYHLKESKYDNFLVSMGFKVQDFGYGKSLQLEELTQSRKNHESIYKLMEAIPSFHVIPSAFPVTE